MIGIKNILKNTIRYNYLEKNTNVVNIAYGIDDNYARCMAASIVSFCLNNPNINFNFHVIASDLSNITKKRLSILAQKFKINIFIYEIDVSFFQNMPIKHVISLAAYFRILFPNILTNIKLVYYIDADIICLKNINKLLNIDLENNIIAAIPDKEIMNKKRNPELKLKDHIYFNSGMIVMDIEKWNECNISHQLLNILTKYKSIIKYEDQDALNIVLSKKVKYIDNQFNCMDINNINPAKIILLHFANHPKPWSKYWYLNVMNNEFTCNIYSVYEKYTPWNNDKALDCHDYSKIVKWIIKKILFNIHIYKG